MVADVCGSLAAAFSSAARALVALAASRACSRFALGRQRRSKRGMGEGGEMDRGMKGAQVTSRREKGWGGQRRA